MTMNKDAVLLYYYKNGLVFSSRASKALIRCLGLPVGSPSPTESNHVNIKTNEQFDAAAGVTL